MIARIQVRRDSESNWTVNNPILTLGEIGYDTDTEKFKVGISSTSRWNDLPYQLGQWDSDASGNISYGYASHGPTEGNVSIKNDLFVDGSLTVLQDLTVKGTTATINTVDSTFKDVMIQLNYNVDDNVNGGPYLDTLKSGFEVNRGNVTNIGQSSQQIYWHENLFGVGSNSGVLPNGGAWVIDSDLNVLGDIYSNGIALWRLNGNDIYFDNGYVGIGLDNPSSILHIKDVAPIITLEDENNPAHIWQVGQNADKFFINTETAADGSMFSMLDDGKVGIGAVVPLATLHLKDNTPDNENICIRFENDAQSWDLCNRGGDSDKFKLVDVNADTSPFIVEKASPTSSLYVKSDGNVGINTATPSEKLEVLGNIKATNNISSATTKTYQITSNNGTDEYYYIGKLQHNNGSDGYANIVVYNHVDYGLHQNTRLEVQISQRSGTFVGNALLYGDRVTGENVDILCYEDSASQNIFIYAKIDSFGLSIIEVTHMGGSDYQISQNTEGTTVPTSSGARVDGGSEIFNSADNIDFMVSKDGNVGIGETTPTTKLEILGLPYVLTDSGKSVGGIHLRTQDLRSDGEYTNAISFSHQNHTASSSISGVVTGGDGDNLGLSFITHPSSTGVDDAVEAMRINHLGDVGIGTTPSQKLHVAGSIRSDTLDLGRVLVSDSTNKDIKSSSITTNELGYLSGVSSNIQTQIGNIVSSQWTTSGSNIYYNTGDVGIGNTNPSAKLDVSGEVNFSGLTDSFVSSLSQPRIYRSATNTSASPPVYPFNDYGHLILQSRTDGTNRDIVFATGTDGANLTVIDSSGKVGINNTNPSELLDVVGNITATGTITSSSDITLKENIELISDPIEKVKEISGYTFNKKGQDLRLVGLIAQEVEKVLPEAVAENNEGLKSVAYGNLVALLVECVKKQDERIESLERTIEEMK